MPHPERQQIPDWAQRERTSDLAWIGENLHVFWPAAQQGYQEHGRGAIVVDTTSRPTGAGHPFAYLPQAGIEQMNEVDAIRMMKAYDPTWEFVTMLFKSQDRLSTYRVGIPTLKPDKP
jgi:hypothetical protein